MVLLAGARIDCWQTRTAVEKVTDVGLKAFSAALGSSTTITTVDLECKSEWLVTLLSVGPCVVVYADVFGRCVDMVVCGVVCVCVRSA